VVEPDALSRSAPPTGGRAARPFGPDALQILTTEHWSLLAARSLVYTEAMSRTSIFVAAVSGAVVALALVAQATDFGSGFVAFALVLLPVVYFLGAATFVRLLQINWEDGRWVQGMNRIRNAYLEITPELEPYFVTSRYDDDLGVLQSSVAMRKWPPPTQAFVAVPGVVGVIASAVAGATVGIVGVALDLGTAGALVLGGATFLVSVVGFARYGWRTLERSKAELEPLFPSPPD
jgi:hypothetical protein